MTSPKELKDGRYVLVRALGEGSQGETFEAIDRGMLREKENERRDPKALVDDWNRYVQRARTGEKRESHDTVAIKCFRVGKAKAWKDVELAEREARTLAALDHPRLPKYIEHFEEDGALYLVMEKIEGESVAAIGKKRTWSAAEVTRMLEDIGGALRYLHGRSPFIVHRDIKPGNIIRRPDGSFALVDFGSVRDRLKLTGGSTVVGTFGYMAPEQFQGRASPKSDVYGLGATAITMLTGTEPEELPHEGLGIDVARALRDGVPAPLVRMLKAMLAPDPDRRVGSVDDALAYLHRRTESEPPREKSEPPPPTLSQPPPLSRKERRRLRAKEQREARAEKKRRRDEARTRRAPFLPYLVAQLGLLIAFIAVWVTVGLIAPLVLVVLSLLFGSALRRAAGACVRATRRAEAKLRRASDWVSGHRFEELPRAGEPVRVRVRSELDAIRVVTPAQAQMIAIAKAEARGPDPDQWIEDQLASAAEREPGEDPLEKRLARQSAPPLPSKSPPPRR